MLVDRIQHGWDVSPQGAVAIQRNLAGRIVHRDALGLVATVAGIDVGLRHGLARAAVVVLSFDDMAEVETVTATRPISFPYVPGLLTFREAPVILEALSRLHNTPDVLIFDGQGYAHPRRLGLASHVGLLVDHPSIGCAKSCLVGTFDVPGCQRGDRSPLRDGGETIGVVLRTRTSVKPVFVSVGHRVSLARAVDLVLACGRGVKLPEPTRRAHRLASGPWDTD